MIGKHTVEWLYTPPDFFEEVFEHNGINYALQIQNGRAVATLSDVAIAEVKNLSRVIRDELEQIFLAAQLVTRRPYELSRNSARRTSSDGGVELSFSADAVMQLFTGQVDLKLCDAAGNVITDTRKARIEEQRKRAVLGVKYRINPVIVSILKSFSAAMQDSRNELTHLYEIRDALGKKFGHNVCSALGIPQANWKRLGYLANEAPLFQGRHRGKQIGKLRDATILELDEARTIARSMIDAYFEYLESE
jgi:hypothetical protein